MKTREKLETLFWLFIINNTLIFSMLFIGAYFTPSKSAVINIDNFGEGTIEVIYVAIVAAVALAQGLRMMFKLLGGRR